MNEIPMKDIKNLANIFGNRLDIGGNDIPYTSSSTSAARKIIAYSALSITNTDLRIQTRS
jgi:hypothetical protein